MPSRQCEEEQELLPASVEITSEAIQPHKAASGHVSFTDLPEMTPPSIPLDGDGHSSFKSSHSPTYAWSAGRSINQSTKRERRPTHRNVKSSLQPGTFFTMLGCICIAVFGLYFFLVAWIGGNIATGFIDMITNIVSTNIQNANHATGNVTVTASLNEAISAAAVLDAAIASMPVLKSDLLPPDFDFKAYLKWNPELATAGITTEALAMQHYTSYGRDQKLVYKDFNMTIRYTACGGCMNQHYSHIAAIALAHMTHATKVIWPAMQERSSFNNRYHPDATKNMQSWQYLDASSLWDMDLIVRNVREHFGIQVIKHPDNPPLPDMVHPESAFQTHPMDFLPHDEHLRFTKRIYIARHDPFVLARAIMDAGRQVIVRHGRHPTTLLIDLPCTLFMMDNRNLTLVEDVAKLIEFSPYIKSLADKVVLGIRQESGQFTFNGIHLRMEKDAADWAKIIGGPDKYWGRYKDAMTMAGFKKHPFPLYVASGLLKASKEDEWSKVEMERLTQDILAFNYTKMIVYKERYLTPADLQYVSNEQSGLIDFIVMLRAKKLVGIGVSTFSFYLYELRLMQKQDPADTTLMMLSFIGTDELFFSCGIVAIQTRNHLMSQHRLPDLCRKPTGRPCFV